MVMDQKIGILDSVKGYSLIDWSTWGVNTSGNPTGAKLTARQAYAQVGWFKRCVDVRARAAGVMPWAVYRDGSDDPLFTETDELPQAWSWLRVPLHVTQATQSNILAGAAYSFIETTGRRISNLVWFDPWTIEPVYNPKTGELLRFTRTVNGAQRPVTLDEMLWIWPPDVVMETGPANADAEAAAVHAQVLKDLYDYTSDQLRTGLPKKTVFTSDGPRPPEDARKEAEDFLTRMLYRRDTVPRAKVIGGNLKAQTIGADLSDLADKDIGEEHREAISTSLGVPHSLVMSNAANYATADREAVSFITGTVHHDCKVFADAINRRFLRDQGVRLEFEPQRLEVMQQHEQEKAQGLTVLVTAGILTANEARSTLGYNPVEEPQAPEPVAEAATPEVPEDDEMKRLDLERWRRKVDKRGREVKFTPDHLNAGEADVVRERLAVGLALDAVFRWPLSDF